MLNNRSGKITNLYINCTEKVETSDQYHFFQEETRMLTTLSLWLASFLFGGMSLFSFGFAAFLLSSLPNNTARATIRSAFPFFYLFVHQECSGGLTLVDIA